MTRTKLAAALVAMLLAGHSYAQSTPAPAADQQAEAEIRKSLAAWVEATNKKDEKSANTIWVANPVGWMPAAPEFGYKAAFELAGLPPRNGGAYPTFELKIDEVAVAGALAAVHDIWTETLHFEGSDMLVKRTIRGSELWRLQPDGKWRIARYVSAPEKWEKVAPAK